MRRTAGYTWADYRTNFHIVKELEITPVLDKLLEYKRNWIQHVNSVDKKNQLDVNFVFFISLLIVAQHVSGNLVPIIKS